jgi:2-polyprenyl-3-methyl-5-hydroxy-6-metoxy-1,4-benzoquinol methylase
LAEYSDPFDFEALVHFYYEHTPAVSAKQARDYTRGVLAAENRARASLDIWGLADELAAFPGPAKVLEIGCGTGPLMVATHPLPVKMIGVDIAFRWLVVAKKRLAEAGIQAPLICACAEALPFPKESFDFIVSESTIEHVRDQEVVLSESRRVLKPSARFFLSTPNRFSLGPDPQVGIPAGGYLPAAWIAWWVRMQGGIPPHRRLFSAKALRQALVKAGFEMDAVRQAQITPAQRAQFGLVMRWMVDGYRFVQKFPLSAGILNRVGPLFYVSARLKKSG